MIVDEEIEPGLDAVDTADAVDTEAVDLSVYKDHPNVQASVNRRNKLNAEYKKYYDDLTAKIMAQRTGPTFSERMFQLSAALAQPTTRRGFGGVLENITPVLAAQQKAQREGITKRQDALSALQAAQLGQRVGLANQDVSTATAMAKIDAMARKGLQPKYTLGPDGKWRIEPGTGSSPPMNARGQYVVSTLAEANMVPTGAEFVYATDTSNKVHWGK